MRDGYSGPERVLVDPLERGGGTSTAVGIVAISQDGRLLAYSVRHGGTDHFALEILDIENERVLPDRLPDGFCTGFVFAPDGSGFFYSHRQLHCYRPNYRAVFQHHFGMESSEDEEIFVADENPNLWLGILHSPEAGALAYVLFFTGKSQCTSLYLQNLRPNLQDTQPLLKEIGGYFVPFFVGGRLLAYTDFAAPNFRIVRIDLNNSGPPLWHDVVPESESRIQQFAVAAAEVFVTRVYRFSTDVEVFDVEGGHSRTLRFPTRTTIDFLNRTTSSDKLFFSRTSISEPATICCYSPENQRTVAWNKPSIAFDLPTVASGEREIISKDGTRVPVFLAARDDLHAGPLPTFLTGYGGFGSCVTPKFTAFATFLMEQGFLFAVPALRGGSELGEKWHMAGKGNHRQNAFDDFIAAAEWLISQRRSLQGSIAIGGGSNAGLLVGAVITQRPDLFRAAICLGPLLDMTRYHLFDFAKHWAEEYEVPEDPCDFPFLHAYSPYHHVQDGTDYSAVLFISGDADTRCNPMHARKMTARLQSVNNSGHPILLDYTPNRGHIPVQPLKERVQALANRLGFICRELGISI